MCKVACCNSIQDTAGKWGEKDDESSRYGILKVGPVYIFHKKNKEKSCNYQRRSHCGGRYAPKKTGKGQAKEKEYSDN